MSQLRVSSIATTAGTTNISLSSNGVGLDNKVVISGQIGGARGSLSVAQIIPFDEFWVQRGITYNSTTRRFTVPLAGTYRITMNPFTLSGTSGVRVYVGINTDTPGGTTHRGHCYAGDSSHQTMSLDSIVSLNANDYIVFYLAAPGLYDNSGDRFNQFSIERIS